MMTLLWLAMVVLVLVMLLMIASPWMFPKQGEESKQREINIELTRHRLSELDNEQQQGLLSEQSRQQAEQEIKLALVHESGAETAEQSMHIPLMMFMTVVIVAVSGLSYWNSSSLSAVDHWQQAVKRLPELGKRAVLEADSSITPQDLQDFALGLRTQLVKKPDDAVGWLLLGRVYVSGQQMESAIQAFERSLKIDPNRQGTLISYSQALLMTGQESNIHHSITLLTRVVMQTPDSQDALGLLAIAATQLGDKTLAVKSWKQLQNLLKPEEPMYQEVTRRIAQLTEPGSELSIPVTVDISSELKARLPEKGYLFVFAQDGNSENKMPAAVVKLPLSTLPAQVSLSDVNAMVAGYNLSSLTTIRLVARVSADENVQTAPGELQGEVQLTLQPGLNPTQSIVLNKEIM